MDGVFMRKFIKIVTCFILIGFVFGFLNIYQDGQNLKNNLIRLHVVANSDSLEDQQIKLQVKDAIVTYLQPKLQNLLTKEDAIKYVKENLSKLQDIANNVLSYLGIGEQAIVTFEKEAFSKRIYDTFSLPSGVYDALRIQIGKGEGKNWWCVVFPSLCLPAAGVDFQDTAVSAGFSETLTNTISNNSGYRIRFFLLDCMGKLENLFHK